VEINSAAARVENCTLVKNASPGSGGAARFNVAGAMTNCIVYGNIGWDRTARNLWNAAGRPIGYSCLPAAEFSGGTGNIFTDPDFVDFANGD